MSAPSPVRAVRARGAREGHQGQTHDQPLPHPRPPVRRSARSEHVQFVHLRHNYPLRCPKVPGTARLAYRSARWRDRTEEAPHAQTPMDRSRDDRGDDAGRAHRRLCRRRRLPRPRANPLPPGPDGARRGIRVGARHEAGSVRSRTVLPLRRAEAILGRRGQTDPRRSRPRRHDLDRREERGTSFELHASFAVPDLAGDSYAISVCNDPCTISGFREPLTGEISIVATAREGELLTKLHRQQNRTWMVRRQVRKAERGTDEVQAQLLDAEVARSELAIEVRKLIAAGRSPSPTSDRRPLIPAWGAVILTLGLLMVAVAIVTRSRRRFGPLVLDPVEEPERERELASR